MSLHAFVDESYRAGEYLVCAVVVDSRGVQRARQHMRKGLKGSQGRVHMAKENSENKKALLTLVLELDLVVHVVTIRTAGKSQRSARDNCLAELTRALHQLGVSRVVIESCDQDRADRQVVGDVLATLDALSVQVVHLRPHDEPLLWAADVVAWAYGRSGEWKRKLGKLVSNEILL